MFAFLVKSRSSFNHYFFRQLKRLGTVYNPELDIDLSGVSISDGGNVDVSDNDNDFEKNHETLRKRVGDLIKKGSVPFVIGGGNDQSYPNACGLLDAKAK